MFDSFDLPPQLQTLQAVPFPVWPATFNAIVFLLGTILAFLTLETLLSIIHTIELLRIIRHRSVGVLEGLSAYISDIQELTRTHLARVLKYAVCTDGIKLPAYQLSAYIFPFSIEIIHNEEAAALLSFSMCSRSNSIAHIFKGVPVASISRFLRLAAAADSLTDPFERKWLQCGRYLHRWFRRIKAAWLRRHQRESLREFNEYAIEYDSVAATVPWLLPGPETSALYRLLISSMIHDCRGGHVTFPLPSTHGARTSVQFTLKHMQASNPSLNRLSQLIPMVILIEADLTSTSFDEGSQASQFFVISGDPISIQELFIQAGHHPTAHFSPFWISQYPRQLLEHQDVYGLDNEATEKECLICLAAQKDAILLPCRHCSSCSNCLQSLFQDKCPICRTPFVGWIKIPWKGGSSTTPGTSE